MELNGLDIAVFLGFVLAVVGFSMYKSRRERTSEDYFLAGRGLTWPLIGFSIVAANLSTEQFVGIAGQAAGNVGIAVCNWQLTGAVDIVVNGDNGAVEKVAHVCKNSHFIQKH